MATKTSPIVRFMIEKMREAGCAIDARFFRVERCEDAVVGDSDRRTGWSCVTIRFTTERPWRTCWRTS